MNTRRLKDSVSLFSPFAMVSWECVSVRTVESSSGHRYLSRQSREVGRRRRERGKPETRPSLRPLRLCGGGPCSSLRSPASPEAHDSRSPGRAALRWPAKTQNKAAMYLKTQGEFQAIVVQPSFFSVAGRTPRVQNGLVATKSADQYPGNGKGGDLETLKCKNEAIILLKTEDHTID
jgi:hypothetical protein